jgi:dsRNA-specific ribonuclease
MVWTRWHGGFQRGYASLRSPCETSAANEYQADDLKGSGQETVLMTSLYAIVGALALERGGEVANKVVQDKILAPLGFTFSES